MLDCGEKLMVFEKRYVQLQEMLLKKEAPQQDNFAALCQECSRLETSIAAMRRLQNLQQEWAEVKILEQETHDETLGAVIQEEIARLKHDLQQQELAVQVLLLPPDQDDARGAILEVRAGTGGQEAALFAADLFKMYRAYCDLQRWSVEPFDMYYSDLGGLKEGSMAISGQDVFSKLKFEAGVHRVQRVPLTESSGRIHTSAATVAVLPEAQEIDITIDERDLRIDVFRSSGPGGQSVNTTDSAVRITHLPTGVVVQQQDEKSQHKNKAKALKVLRARLYEKKREEEKLTRDISRQSQVGRGDRSERIRTYNFPQGRVTDHRIKLTLYQLPEVLKGEALDLLIDALIREDHMEKIRIATEV